MSVTCAGTQRHTHINVTHAPEVSRNALSVNSPCLSLLAVTLTTVHDTIKWDSLMACFDTQELSKGFLSLHVHLRVMRVGLCFHVLVWNWQMWMNHQFHQAQTKSRSNKFNVFDFSLIWRSQNKHIFLQNIRSLTTAKVCPLPTPGCKNTCMSPLYSEIAVIKLCSYIRFSRCLSSWGNWWAWFAKQSLKCAFCGKYCVFSASISRKNDGKSSRGEKQASVLQNCCASPPVLPAAAWWFFLSWRLYHCTLRSHLGTHFNISFQTSHII